MNGFEIQCLPGAPDICPTMEVFNATLANPEDWMFEAFGGGLSDAGVRVNPHTALSHGPVWGAINTLSGDFGQLPIHVMRQEGRVREKFIEHPVDWLLNGQPNELQTPSTFKESIMSWCAGYGNGCYLIVRSGRGYAQELLPLLPDRTWPEEVDFEDSNGYHWRFWVICSQIGGKIYKFLYQDVLHLPWLTTDGFWGISPVQACKNAIGHGMALEKHGNKTFSNGAMPSGVLEHPGKLTVEARENLRKEWYAVHGGLSNAAKVALLMEGMKFSPISMTSRDAQWMEDREYDRDVIATLFGLPGFKLNSLKNSAVRANLEEQNRDYFNTSLSRHLNKFREECERKLLPYAERRPGRNRARVYIRWFPEAFLRGDTKSRFEAYGAAITHRFMSPNEVREKEDMNPYEGGDEFLNPAIEQTNREEKPAGGKESDPTTDDQQQQLARRLMVKQVAALLETEAKALEKSVGGSPPRNFCNWASNYYEHYPTMAANFVEMAGEIALNSGLSACNWRKAVELHAQDGLQAILSLADGVTKSGLAAVVNEHANEVRAMSEYLTASILGEIDNAK